MTVGVVDVFEVIEIDENHRHGGLVPERPPDLAEQEVVEVATVEKAGEPVGDGQGLEARVGFA